MSDRINDDGPYGHTVGELRHSVIGRVVRDIELKSNSRRGLAPKERGRRKRDVDNRDLHAAFARASRAQEELRRLKATGKPYACMRLRRRLRL